MGLFKSCPGLVAPSRIIRHTGSFFIPSFDSFNGAIKLNVSSYLEEVTTPILQSCSGLFAGR